MEKLDIVFKYNHLTSISDSSMAGRFFSTLHKEIAVCANLHYIIVTASTSYVEWVLHFWKSECYIMWKG